MATLSWCTMIFCYNWHVLCSSNKLLYFSSIHCFLIQYAVKYQTTNELLLPHTLWCWYAESVAGNTDAGTSVYWVMPSKTDIWISSIFGERAMARLIFIGYVLYEVPPSHLYEELLSPSNYSLVSISAYLSFWYHIFAALDSYRYQRRKRNVTKLHLLTPKHIIIQLTKVQIGVMKILPFDMTFEQGCTIPFYVCGNW